MACQREIQYVQFYTAGSAARKLVYEPQGKTQPRPRTRKQSRTLIHVDPVAILGVVTAVIMLTLMLVGVCNLQAAKQRNVAMEQYVTTLQEKNETLEQTYKSGYDIEEVERTALALGMVPKENVQQIPIEVTMEATVEETPDFWDRVSAFLTGLFA